MHMDGPRCVSGRSGRFGMGINSNRIYLGPDRADPTRTPARHLRDQTFLDIAVTNGITGGMTRPLTSAERQRRYIARLKERAAPMLPDVEAVMRALIAARVRIAELEAKLARAERKLAKAKQK